MRKLIFLVDDNGLTRLLARDALVAGGYDVVAFASAREALDAISREVPAACVLDHEMPGLTGSELVRELRRSDDPRLRTLPLVGVTARFEREFLEAGADACVKKPFTQAGLAAAVGAALAGTAAAPREEGTSLASLLSRFKALHDLARSGALDDGRRAAYLGLREELARAFLAVQNHPHALRGTPRRHLRVPKVFPVDVDIRAARLQATAVDLGVGGFAAVVPTKLERHDEAHVVLHVPDEPPVAGRARVGNVVAGPGGYRAGFAFFALPAAEAERVEALVFDSIFSYLLSVRAGV